MNNPAVFSLLSRFSEQPFWQRRDQALEQSALLRLAGLPAAGVFHAPPLPTAFTAAPLFAPAIGSRRRRG